MIHVRRETIGLATHWRAYIADADCNNDLLILDGSGISGWGPTKQDAVSRLQESFTTYLAALQAVSIEEVQEVDSRGNLVSSAPAVPAGV